MIIILRKIPQDTKKYEIEEFLSPALKGGLLQRSGHIESINIMALKDAHKNTLEYHGLVTIDSSAAANRAIKHQSRTRLKNRPIIIKEYFHRSWHNDQRVNMHEWNEELNEKRSQTRRRAKLEVLAPASLHSELEQPTLKVL